METTRIKCDGCESMVAKLTNYRGNLYCNACLARVVNAV